MKAKRLIQPTLRKTAHLIAGASLWLAAPARSELSDYRYKFEVLETGMPQPMELELAPDGRIFFNEIGGSLKVWKPQIKASILCGKLEVFNEQENGFLGFALDPNFAKNQWIYCLYSPPGFSGQRLSRFTMQGDTMDLTSEKVILESEEQRKTCCHHAGSVEFDTQGNLLFSSGDNTNPFGSDGFSPSDERPEREPWDAQRTSANTANLIGKILRIRPTADGRYTIPDGNLFPKDGSAGRPEIFVMGCRNPWRISIDPKSGYLYWGEVGPDSRKDSERGPRGYDEINQARTAGFFGWPLFVGANFAYSKYDFEAQSIGAAHDPAKPRNLSVNNSGLRDLPPAKPAFIYWPYEDSKEFPMLGTGGRTACAGPVFHFEPGFEKTNGFPKEYDNSLLFWDWQRPFVKWARLASSGDLAEIVPFSSAMSVVSDKVKDEEVTDGFIVRRPVDAVFGPDGCLYMLDYGLTWGANPDSKLIKISYVRGNLPPVIKLQASTTSGREPLTVAFDAQGTHKREGGEVHYQWRIEEHGSVVSTDAKFSNTFQKPGNYKVELTASDSKGASDSKSVTIVVGNSPPEVEFESPKDGDFFTHGKPVAYKIRVTDLEDGSSEQVGDAMGLKVGLETRWLKSVDDKPALHPGLALMKQSDCFNCHQLDQKLVGPALVDVATRYRGVSGALEATIQRVRNGSAGVWGEVPMLAHQQHTSDEIAQMVAWVYSLEPGKTGASLQKGLKGEVSAPTDAALKIAALEASYADNGRGDAASLIGKTIVRLRTRRIEAEGNEVPNGCKPIGAKGASGGKALGSINDGHSLIFRNIPLHDVGGLTCRVSSGGEGGKIELHSGSKDGPTLAEFEVKPTGGWDSWVELKSKITHPKPDGARTDIVAVFRNPNKTGLMNLDWVQFDAPSVR